MITAKPMTIGQLSFLVLFALGLISCGGNDDRDVTGSSSPVHSKPAEQAEDRGGVAALTPMPIRIDYELMGVPVVGVPLSINVQISSELDQAIVLTFRINETTGLRFADAQSERRTLSPADGRIISVEQVTVIPQREGRLFLNVSASIESEPGMVARVIAIPIEVGGQRSATSTTGT
jgi:hypothetical protein